MRILGLLAQVVLAFFLTPLAQKFGLLSAINLATTSNFNLRYQLHFVIAHFGDYVVAILLALVFWLVGRLIARVLRGSRAPSFLTLIATIVLTLAFAYLSQLPIAGSIATVVYQKFYTTVPSIIYPLVGAVLAALLVPGKRV